MLSKNAGIWVISGVAVAGVLIGLLLWLRERPLCWHAERLVRAQIEGDIDTMYEYSFAIEQEALSKSELQQVWEAIARTEYESVDQSGWVRQQASFMGACSGEYTLPADERVFVISILVDTENGPRGPALHETLKGAWAIRWYRENPEAEGTIFNLLRAVQEGLSEDVQELERLAPNGCVTGRDMQLNSGEVFLTSWREQLDRWTKMVESLDETGTLPPVEMD